MVSHISRTAYRDRIKGHKESSQNELVLNSMSDLPQTIRQVHARLKDRIDLVSLRRSVHNLHKAGELEIAYEAPCPITNITVGWYRRTKKLINGQTELF